MISRANRRNNHSHSHNHNNTSSQSNGPVTPPSRAPRMMMSRSSTLMSPISPSSTTTSWSSDPDDAPTGSSSSSEDNDLRSSHDHPTPHRLAFWRTMTTTTTTSSSSSTSSTTRLVRTLSKVVFLVGGSVLYGYAFFTWQPNRSYPVIHTRNLRLRQRALLQQQHRQVQQQGRELDLDSTSTGMTTNMLSLLLAEEDEEDYYDEGIPEWQRRMRARGAGEMVWKKEQEQLLGGPSSSYLRGGDYYYPFDTDDSGDPPNKEDPPEETTDHHQQQQQTTNNTKKKKRRPHHHHRHPPNPRHRSPRGNFVLDFLVMMSVFAITRTILRVCVFYRQLSRMLHNSQEGLAGLLPPNDITTTNNNNNTNNTARTTSRRSSSSFRNNTTNRTTTTTTTRNTNSNNNNNSGRAALARLMVPPSMLQQHATTLLRNARFRAWATHMNQQRQENQQPPLSMESLRLLVTRGDADFDGNDYEALLQFQNDQEEVERGTTTRSTTTTESVSSLSSTMGATAGEMEHYCPRRVLTNSLDSLLQSATASSSASSSPASSFQECPICLEHFQRGDTVRQIYHCRHVFHAQCIEPWLSHRAVCPVCKHSVVTTATPPVVQ